MLPLYTPYLFYTKPTVLVLTRPLCGYARRMDVTTAPARWPDSILNSYADLLTVDETSTVLNIEPRSVRSLLVHANPAVRLPGVKVGTNWRIAREELRTYLLAHHNANYSSDSGTAQRGTP